MRLTLFILFLIPIQILAAPLIVDGPGDGDGDGNDDYDSVQAALVAIGPTGDDNVADEIRIMVDALNEPVGWELNGAGGPVEIFTGPLAGQFYPPLRDDLLIDGDGDGNSIRCVMDVSEAKQTFPPIVLGGTMGPGQHITIRDLVIVPTHGSSLSGAFFDMRIGGSEFRLERVDFLPSLSGNNPVDPDSPEGGGTTISGGPVLKIPGGGADFVMENCVIAHHGATALEITHSTATPVVTLRDSRFLRNDGYGVLIHAYGEYQTYHFSGLVCEGNLYDGCRVGSGTVFLNSSPGHQSSFSFNGEDGMELGWCPLLEMSASPESPALFIGNSESGVDAAIVGEKTNTIENMISADNGRNNLSVFWPDGQPTYRVSNSLFARSGVLGNIEVTGQSNKPASITFSECTFHDRLMLGNEPAQSIVNVVWLSSLALPVSFEDCIFSGTDDDVAFSMEYATSAEMNLTNCAVVLEGDHALGAITATGDGTINMIDCTLNDPQYLNVDTPPDEDSFDINATFYGHAGPGGGPLSGWGDYVGEPYDGGGAGLEMH